ncbi:MAG: glycosyltransferase [Chloroflexi bacterium]|nr:MAG: glycosyltransferase [Chloroflexota bacterium]
MSNRPRFSIVAPIYNEEGNIQPLYERIREVMDSTGESWELVAVNDGSRDNSLPLLLSLAEQDKRVKVVNFARNFGHQVAVTAGIDFAQGDAVVLIDADLQDPPEVILDLIAKWREGYEVVYAIRDERQGETWFKKFTAGIFYRVIYRITDIDIPLDTGDFRLMDRKVVQVLRQMREHNRFIRGMTSWVGFKQTGVHYVRHARYWGETKYPLGKMIRFALDAITGFSYFPLQIIGHVSLVMAFLAILAGIVISLLRLTQGPEFFGGQATTIVLLLLLSSFQLFFLYVLGQYVARIYDDVRHRPLYVVASTTGFDESKVATESPTPPVEMQNQSGEMP